MTIHKPWRLHPRVITCLMALAMLLCHPATTLADPGVGATLEINDTLPVVVSMGDSYSSGEGCPEFYGTPTASIGTPNYRDWVAHRSKNAWPGQLVLDAGDKSIRLRDCKDTNWFFVAGSGAESEHIYERGQEKEAVRYIYTDVGMGIRTEDGLKFDRSELPRQDYVFELIRDAGRDVDYVTLTIGGNDIGFAGIVISLAKSKFEVGGVRDSLVYAWRLYEKGDAASEDFNKRKPAKETIYGAYKDIREQAGSSADVIVAGYPKLFDESDALLWTTDSARLVNENILLFNQKLKGLTEQADMLTDSDDGRFVFVDVVDPFEGRGIGSHSSFINGIMIFPRSQDISIVPPSAYSVHPNFCGSQSCCATDNGIITPNCGISAYAFAVQQAVGQLDSKTGVPGLRQTAAEDFLRGLDGWWAQAGGQSTSTGSGYRSVMHLSDGAFEVYDGDGNMVNSGEVSPDDLQRLENGPGATRGPGWYVWPPEGYFCSDDNPDLLERIGLDGTGYSMTSSYMRIEEEPDWNRWTTEPAPDYETGWEGRWEPTGGELDGASITVASDGSFKLYANRDDTVLPTEDQGTWRTFNSAGKTGIVLEGTYENYNIVEEGDGGYRFYMYELSSEILHIQ